MNPPTVAEPRTPSRTPRRLGQLVGAAGLIVAAAVALASLVDLGAGSATVTRITYENPTDYALSVEVSSGAGDRLDERGLRRPAVDRGRRGGARSGLRVGVPVRQPGRDGR